MDFIKLDSKFDDSQLEEIFSKVLYSDAKGKSLSAPAKEMQYGAKEKHENNELPWNAYTLIRIVKNQSAVIVCGDKVMASRAKPGDYAIQDTADLSAAKVYFISTEDMSSKMLETHTPVPFRAEDKILGVSQDIRLQCAGYFNYRISHPKEFMKYVLTQSNKRITKQTLENEMSSIFSVCLPDLLGQLANEGVPYTEICASTDRITEFMRKKLAVAWKKSRGIELKEFTIVMAQPSRDDEEAFIDKCRKAKEAQKDPKLGTEQFSEEFESVMKELGKVAGDALHTFSQEMISLFGGLAEEFEKEFDKAEKESESDEKCDDFDIDSILEGCHTDVMGTWECPELGQTVRFELLYAVIETNGQQVWMGDWEEREVDGYDRVICPTADSLGYYKYFEYHNDDEDEFLAGIILDTDDEKQYIRFVRKDNPA